ncbi:MAG: S-layer homology domain-containing protein [Oscillospiraceae bacterium]|nr:S-layer homology domain-containing protein [Oscillospiraceae bacterium]
MKQNAKKLLCGILALVMLAGLMPAVSLPARADDPAATPPRTIVLGTASLAVKANTEDAAKVYFGLNESNAHAAWRVVGYNGAGAASSKGDMTLLAADIMGTTVFGDTNEYASSYLKTAVDALAGKLEKWEKSAVKAKTLEQGEYSGNNTTGVAGQVVKNALLWPLSTAEAGKVSLYLLDDAHRVRWLRSPGSDNDGLQRAGVVKDDGTVYAMGAGCNSRTDGVYPAMNIDLDNVLFISAANGSRTDAIPNSAAFNAVKSYENYTTGGWKLTVLDQDRKDFTALAVSRNAAECEIQYSGAQTGDNEYLSAVIVDDGSGEVTHYARLLTLDQNASSSGTYTISLYDNEAGDCIDMTDKSLYVFNEHLSGEYKTDCASALIKIGEPYGLWVGGVPVTSENCGDVLGDGKVSYDPINYELTFDTGSGAIVVENAYRFALTTADARALPLPTETESEYDLYKDHVPSEFWKLDQDPNNWGTVGYNDEVFALTAGIFVGSGIDELTVKVTGDGLLDVDNSEYNFGVGIYAPLTNLVFASDDDTEAAFRGDIGIYAKSLGIQSGGVYGRGYGDSVECYGVWSENGITVGGGYLHGMGGVNNYNPGIRAARKIEVSYKGVLAFPNNGIAVGDTTYKVEDIESAVEWNASTHALFTGDFGSSDYLTVVHPIELNSIAVTKAPNKTAYKAGDSFNSEGMKVTAYYNARYGIGNHTLENDKDTFAVDITDKVTVTASAPLKASDKTVTVSFTDDRVNDTETADVTITVTSPYVPTVPAAPADDQQKGRPSEKFKDVDPNAWYIEYIDYVIENGLMNGVSEDLFAPNATTTRAMIVTILYRLEGSPDVSGTNPFKDVKSSQWYTNAIIWAAENDIVTGYGDGKFGINDDITREQLAAIMYRYAKYKGYDVTKAADLSGYTDASGISEWALDAMKWAVAEELITGRTATTLAPKGNATRAEAAAILTRFIENIK